MTKSKVELTEEEKKILSRILREKPQAFTNFVQQQRQEESVNQDSVADLSSVKLESAESDQSISSPPPPIFSTFDSSHDAHSEGGNSEAESKDGVGEEKLSEAFEGMRIGEQQGEISRSKDELKQALIDFNISEDRTQKSQIARYIAQTLKHYKKLEEGESAVSEGTIWHEASKDGSSAYQDSPEILNYLLELSSFKTIQQEIVKVGKINGEEKYRRNDPVANHGIFKLPFNSAAVEQSNVSDKIGDLLGVVSESENIDDDTIEKIINYYANPHFNVNPDLSIMEGCDSAGALLDKLGEEGLEDLPMIPKLALLREKLKPFTRTNETTTSVDPNKSELVLQINRRRDDGSFINDPVLIDNFTITNQENGNYTTCTPTSFVVFNNERNHYVTYIQKRVMDNSAESKAAQDAGGSQEYQAKWFYYDDLASEVQEFADGDEKLEADKKQAYYVKYSDISQLEQLLPIHRNNSLPFNDGNRCYLNSALMFLGSITQGSEMLSEVRQNVALEAAEISAENAAKYATVGTIFESEQSRSRTNSNTSSLGRQSDLSQKSNSIEGTSK